MTKWAIADSLKSSTGIRLDTPIYLNRYMVVSFLRDLEMRHFLAEKKRGGENRGTSVF